MNTDVTIIGGGIVGLSTALQLIQKNSSLRVILLEKEPELALHQTGHNSGVIHSGIYYKPGSLKAINCIRGYHLLLDFCRTYDVPYEITGKIVVAVKPKELPFLHDLYHRGKQNGLNGLRQLSASEILKYEPYVRGLAGIFVPQTGLIDYKKLALKIASLSTSLGVTIQKNCPVTGLIENSREVAIQTATDDRFTSKLVINCAGLYSDKIARYLGHGKNIQIIPFRGEYYKLKKEKNYLVKNLVYPVPDPAFPFLGVHFTRMIQGGIEAGPNAVLALSREGYKKTDFRFREATEIFTWIGFQKITARYWRTGISEIHRSLSKTAFTKTLQNLIPSINKEDIEFGGSGVRAQACSKDGRLIDDFLIFENPRALHLCNAPSPAATSCLSIGETLAQRAFEKLKSN